MRGDDAVSSAELKCKLLDAVSYELATDDDGVKSSGSVSSKVRNEEAPLGGEAEEGKFNTSNMKRE